MLDFFDTAFYNKESLISIVTKNFTSYRPNHYQAINIAIHKALWHNYCLHL